MACVKKRLDLGRLERGEDGLVPTHRQGQTGLGIVVDEDRLEGEGAIVAVSILSGLHHCYSRI
jgi:hypothetical protein